jgi:hypothetical protein
MLACWYPETNLVFVDLDQLIGLKAQGNVAAMLLLLHELTHAVDGGRRSRPWSRFSGAILNISDLAFKSIEGLLKTRLNDAELRRTKTRILMREIAMDRLFLASRKVVEILAAYQLKKTSLPLLGSLQRPTGLREEAEGFYERMFRLREAEFLKSFEKEIPSEILAKMTRKAWSRDKPTIIRKDIMSVEETINRFLAESFRDSTLRTLHERLAKIENLSASRDLPIYLCRLALDVPFHHDARKWVTRLPLQFNPERRLPVLLDAVERLLDQTDNVRHRLLAEWVSRTGRSESPLDLERELDQVISKESGVEFYDVFSPDHPKNIHFNCEMKRGSLAFEENDGIRSRNDVIAFFRRGMESGFRGKTPAAVLVFLQQWGFLPVAAYVSHHRFRFTFSPRYDFRYWKIGWCLNYLKDQIISNPDPDAIVNPANLGYFRLPEHVRKEVVRATGLARKVAEGSVPGFLLRAYEKTSDALGRVLPT